MLEERRKHRRARMGTAGYVVLNVRLLHLFLLAHWPSRVG